MLVDLGHEVIVAAHRQTEVPSFLAGPATVEPLDDTDRDAFLALAGCHDTGDIVHLAGSLPDEDPGLLLLPHRDDPPARRAGRRPHLGRPQVRRWPAAIRRRVVTNGCPRGPTAVQAHRPD
jgi:hypothetical protein